VKRAIILPEACRNCEICEAGEVCQQDAFIREKKEDKPWIDFYQCRGCLKCKPAWRSRGIDSTVQRKRQDELVSNKNKGAA